MDAVIERNRKSSVAVATDELKKLQAPKGLKGDYSNLVVLILLYVLQGIPMGNLLTIPMILSSNNVGYDKQAIFTFASYPYAIKLLWAPIVDSIYSEKFGRRKSWLIPAQLTIGVSFLIMSPFSDDLVGTKTIPPQIYLLTLSMFLIIFMTATQDIAVDAWGLTLLSKRNLHYCASCNTVGLVLGAFFSSTLFLALESADFCNKFLRTKPQTSGIINIQQYFFAVGVLYICSTIVIWIFKKEKNVLDDKDKINGLLNTYKMLFKIMKLKSVLLFILVHSTHYISSAVFSAATDLKLIQFGVPKETVFALKLPVAIINLILPFIVVNKTKKSPLRYFWFIGIIRQVFFIAKISILYWTQTFNNPKDGFPIYFYIVVFSAFVMNDVLSFSSGITWWAYMATIADPIVGGTYMTLLATIVNISGKWPQTVALALIDALTFKQQHTFYENVTYFNATIINGATYNVSTTAVELKVHRFTVFDGYTVEGLFCLVYGVIWFLVFKKLIWQMQRWQESNWRIKNNALSSITEEMSTELTNVPI